MAQVARLYYEDDQTQEEIAAALGLSRPKISRLLRQARDEGIVQISIHDPLDSDEPLAQQLLQAFDLKTAIVVPSGSGLTNRHLGHAAARYLAETLHDGDALGIGWGRTLCEVVNALPDREREAHVHVVPLVGGLGQVSPSFQVNELAQRLAMSFGGTWQCLYAPAILESQEALNTLAAQPDIQRITERWSHLKYALVGIGNSDFHSEVRVLFIDYLRPEVQDSLRAAGAAGDICVRFFDGEGIPCPSNVSVLGIDLAQLKAVEQVIAVAGGANKVDAILGALRGGYVSTLITDSVAAQGILQSSTQASASK
jgi:deoxyribonucleoside regulator